MASRTISLTQDAYDRLRRAKKPDESFSDVVRRLTKGRSLLELTQIATPELGQRLAEAVERGRAERLALRKKELGI